MKPIAPAVSSLFYQGEEDEEAKAELELATSRQDECRPPEDYTSYLFSQEEYERLKYESPLVKQLRTLQVRDKYCVCCIPNSGLTTLVVSMVTRHIAVCYENYAFRHGRLFHSELWNDYSSGFYGNQTYSGVLWKLHLQTWPSVSFRTLDWQIFA